MTLEELRTAGYTPTACCWWCGDDCGLYAGAELAAHSPASAACLEGAAWRWAEEASDAPVSALHEMSGNIIEYL